MYPFKNTRNGLVSSRMVVQDDIDQAGSQECGGDLARCRPPFIMCFVSTAINPRQCALYTLCGYHGVHKTNPLNQPTRLTRLIKLAVLGHDLNNCSNAVVQEECNQGSENMSRQFGETKT